MEIQGMIEILEDIGTAKLEPLTAKQRDILRENHTHNLNCVGVYIYDRQLIITNESTLKNWEYYAGLEYIDQTEYSLFRHDGQLLVVFPDSIDRIAEIIDSIE